MKKVTQVLTLILCTFLFTTVAQAQSVDEIIDTYLENIGGADKWKEVKSMKVIGKSAMQGMEFPVERTAMRPNKFRMDINVMEKNIVQAYDGETAWSINPFQGGEKAQKADADMTKEFAKEDFEDAFIDYKDKGHTVTLEGKEEVDGTETFKIKMVKKDGSEIFYYFDMENMVPIMFKSFAEVGPQKGQAVETYVSDYQEVDGLYMPFSMEQKMGGQTFMQMTMEKVEFNAEIDEKIFAFPEADAADEKTKDNEEEEKGGK